MRRSRFPLVAGGRPGPRISSSCRQQTVDQAGREHRATGGRSLDLREVHRPTIGGIDDAVACARAGEHESAAAARGDRDGSGCSIVFGSPQSSITCRSPSTSSRSTWRGRSRRRARPEPFGPRCSKQLSALRAGRGTDAGSLVRIVAGVDGAGRLAQLQASLPGSKLGTVQIGLWKFGSTIPLSLPLTSQTVDIASLRRSHGAATAPWVFTGE